MKEPRPFHERERLEALRACGILDTPPEAAFDEITRLAAAVCETPLAMVSLVDESRQWFKSKVGTTICGTAREDAFCAHAICGEGIMEVPDACEDSRFAENPLVTGETGVRFYAGHPLTTADGHAIGALCVLDRRPRQLNPAQRMTLEVLARQVMGHLEIRRLLDQRRKSENRTRRMNAILRLMGSINAEIVREPNRQALLETVCRLVLESGMMRSIRIALADHEAGFLKVVAESGPVSRDFGLPVPLESPDGAECHPFLEILGTNRRRVWKDLGGQVDLVPGGFAPLDCACRSLACFPLRQGGVPLGVIILCAEDPVVFGDDESELLAEIADNISFAIEMLGHAEERRRVEAVSDRLFELSADMLCVAGFDGRLNLVNPAWTSVLGWERDELVGAEWMSFVHPDDREETRIVGGNLYRGIPVRNFENRYLCKDGSVRWLSWNSQPLPEVRQVFATARDVTERRNRNLALARSNRSLSLLLALNEALGVAESESDWLSAACRIAVDVGGFAMAWFGQFLPDEGIMPGAAAGAGADELPEGGHPCHIDDPCSDSPVSRTFRDGRLRVARDFEGLDDQRPWRDFEEAHGLSGMICLAVKIPNRTLGVFVLYLSGPRVIEDGELELLRNMADRISHGMNGIRAARDARRMHEAVISMGKGFSMNSSRDFFEHLSFKVARVLGARAAVIARTDAKGVTAHSLCAIEDGIRSRKVSFKVAGSPFEALDCGRIRFIAAGAGASYPDFGPLRGHGGDVFAGVVLGDSLGRRLGFMFVLFDSPPENRDFVLSSLRIFATRVAGELERLDADTLLREQAALLDKASDAILVHDFRHRVKYWNQGASRLFGRSPEEAAGRDMARLTRVDRVLFENALNRTINAGEWAGEFEMMKSDGNPIIVESRWSLLRDEENRPHAVLSIHTDITERRKIEQQLLRAQRMDGIGTLAGGIAHDMNNVLAPIMMSVDMLRPHVTDPDAANILNIVGASARRGADMIGRILSFARGVEGRVEVVRMSAIVEELLQITGETFPRNIIVETLVPEDLWPVKADPTRIQQVLLNLCVNARDAMPDGGRLMLRFGNVLLDEGQAAMQVEARPGPYVVSEVEDTGPGIPAGDLERIFDPFFTTKEPGKGTGLGLSSCLAIIKSHGGFLRVSSGLGHGARFRFHLPAADEAMGPGFVKPPRRSRRGRGRMVMIVDDEPLVRETARRALESSGFRVVMAGNGSEAISQFVQHREEIKVVLMDMAMPVMDGPTAIRELRRLDPSLQIVGSSALSQASKIRRAREAGMAGFLAKPYSADELLAAVSDALAGGD